MQHNITTYALLHTIIAYIQHPRSLTERANLEFCCIECCNNATIFEKYPIFWYNATTTDILPELLTGLWVLRQTAEG